MGKKIKVKQCEQTQKTSILIASQQIIGRLEIRILGLKQPKALKSTHAIMAAVL